MFSHFHFLKFFFRHQSDIYILGQGQGSREVIYMTFMTTIKENMVRDITTFTIVRTANGDNLDQ